MKQLVLLLCIMATLATGALAQTSITRAPIPDLVDSYRAYISRDDLYNSRGVRLTKPWQIIRQDRANFYEYGIRDRGDEGDSFFINPANRQKLEDMLANGTITRRAASMIVHGDVWIDVNIYGHGGRGRWVDVIVTH